MRRQMTADELRAEMIRLFPTRDNRAVESADLSGLLQIARQRNISTERDATPPPRRAATENEIANRIRHELEQSTHNKAKTFKKTHNRGGDATLIAATQNNPMFRSIYERSIRDRTPSPARTPTPARASSSSSGERYPSIQDRIDLFSRPTKKLDLEKDKSNLPIKKRLGSPNLYSSSIMAPRIDVKKFKEDNPRLPGSKPYDNYSHSLYKPLGKTPVPEIYADTEEFFMDPENVKKVANYIKNDANSSLSTDQIVESINTLRKKGILGTDKAPPRFRAPALMRAVQAYAEFEGAPEGEEPKTKAGMADYRLRRAVSNKTKDDYEDIVKNREPKESLDYLKERLEEEAKFKLPQNEYNALIDKAKERNLRKMTLADWAESEHAKHSKKLKDVTTRTLFEDNEAKHQAEIKSQKEARSRGTTPGRAVSTQRARSTQRVRMQDEPVNVSSSSSNTSAFQRPSPIRPSAGSSPLSSFMESVSAVQQNAPQIAEQRQSAVNSPVHHTSGISAVPGSPASSRAVSPELSAPRAARPAREPIPMRKKINGLFPYEPVTDPIEEAEDDIENIYDKKKEREGFVKEAKISPVSESYQKEGPPRFIQDTIREMIAAKIDDVNKPYQEYGGTTVAPMSEEEENARQMIYSENPFLNETIQAQEKEVKDKLKEIHGAPKSSEAAAPYLAEMTKNPARFHNEYMGPMEEEFMTDMETRSNRNFKEKILPELRRGYLVPGMVRSGGMNKTIRDAEEQNARGLREDMNKARVGNRLATMNAGQNYARLHGDAAKLASDNASSDIKKQMEITNMLQGTNNQERELRRQGAADMQTMGINVRNWKQQTLNDAYKRFIEKRDHPSTKLGELSDLTRGNPTGEKNTTKVSQLMGNPAFGKQNTLQTVGKATAALGAANLPQRQYKKGGVIKKNKYADGGQIMSQANENAVIDHEDPLTALRKLMNRQRMMDVYETKIGKRRYREGGQVNPIMAGAEQARQFMGEKDLRAHIESKKTPRKLGGVDMIDIFMKAAATDGDANAFSRTARGYTVGADERNKKIQNNETRQSQAFKDLYGLDKDAKKELSGLRKEEREEKKMLADEKYRNAMLSETGTYHKGRLALEREKLGASDSEAEYGDIAVRKQTKDEKAAVKKANEMLRAARLHKYALAKTKGIEDVPTSPNNEALIKSTPLGLGYSLVSGKEKVKDFFGQGSNKSKDLSGEQIKDYEDRTKEAFQSGLALEKSLASTGGRFTNLSHGAMESSKMNLGSSPKSNVEKRSSGNNTIREVALETAQMKINAGIDPNVVGEQLKEFGLSLKDLKPAGSLIGSEPVAPAQPTVPTPIAPAGVNPEKLAAAMKAERERRLAMRGGVQ